MTDPRTIAIERAIDEVRVELSRALGKFAVFHSPHEGYAVILEELDALWTRVKDDDGRTLAAQEEALQVAAMALRYVIDLCAPLPLPVPVREGRAE